MKWSTYSDLRADPDAPLEHAIRTWRVPLRSSMRKLLRAAEALHRRYPVPNLALSGGCAMNQWPTAKVYLRTPFRRMYLPAAAGDAGGAIGAACVVNRNWTRPEVRRAENRSQKSEIRVLTSDLRPLNSAYIGPHFF